MSRKSDPLQSEPIRLGGARLGLGGLIEQPSANGVDYVTYTAALTRAKRAEEALEHLKDVLKNAVKPYHWDYQDEPFPTMTVTGVLEGHVSAQYVYIIKEDDFIRRLLDGNDQ